MSVAENILENFNLFVDGRGYAGNIEGLTLPNLQLKLEDFRGGGMDATVGIEMGMEKLESSFSLTKTGAEAMRLFGVSKNGRGVPLTARGSIKTPNGKLPVLVQMEGTISGIETDEWKSGEKVTTKYTVQLIKYKYTLNGELIHHIDIPNMIRIIDGVDQLAETRSNLGM